MSNYKSLLNEGVFNPDVNFWKAFPQLKHLGAFKTLYKEDRDRTKKKSSNAMWFVAYCFDPASPLSGEENEGEYGAFALVGRDYLEDAEYKTKNEVLLTPVIEYYKSLTETPGIKGLKVWEDKMRQRDTFLMSTPYSFGEVDENGKRFGDTALDLDKMIANTPKLYDQLAKTKAALEEEKNNTRSVGGSKASASEAGNI